MNALHEALRLNRPGLALGIALALVALAGLAQVAMTDEREPEEASHANDPPEADIGEDTRAGQPGKHAAAGDSAAIAPPGKAAGPPPDRPSDVLASYLRSSRDDAGQRTRAVDVIEKAQVVTLHYERDTPTATPGEIADFARSLKGSWGFGITHHKGGQIFPAIQAVFSRFNEEAGDMTADEWLEQMKRPIAAGYKLKSITAVLTPSRGIMQASFARSRSVMRSAASELMKIKTDFSQLAEFTAMHHDPGSETGPDRSGNWEQNWPRYPHVRYEHDVGPERKGGREGLSDDWCALSFGIGPISGRPRAKESPRREYPNQGIVAGWSIESGSDRLNQAFGRIVAESLKELDALERELGNSENAPAPAPPGTSAKDGNVNDAPEAAVRQEAKAGEPASDSVDAVTEQLFRQYVVGRGKIPTSSVKAAIELVAARGRSPAFIKTLLAEFEKSCEQDARYIRRNLLALISKMLAAEGAQRWQYEHTRRTGEAGPIATIVRGPPSPENDKIVYRESEMLARVIARGRQADRHDIDAFVIAVRQAHHPQGKQFLLDVLRNPLKNAADERPFDAGTRPEPQRGTTGASGATGKWPDNTGSSWLEAKFHAAVGLAELGEHAGVEWLIQQSERNEFGVGSMSASLDHAPHAQDTRGNLRESCLHALADLSGLQFTDESAPWKTWWAANKDRFEPRRVALRID